jgi:hypothetical protein
MFNYENRQMASDFKVFISINHVRFAHSWVDKKIFRNVWKMLWIGTVLVGLGHSKNIFKNVLQRKQPLLLQFHFFVKKEA